MDKHMAIAPSTQKLTLDNVKLSFAHWRRDPARSSRIPEELWQQVFQILPAYPPSRVRSALGISKAQLEQKLNQRQKTVAAVNANENTLATSNSNSMPRFIKAKIPDINSDISLTNHDVIITRTNGSTLQVNQLPYADILKLVNQFMGD